MQRQLQGCRKEGVETMQLTKNHELESLAHYVQFAQLQISHVWGIKWLKKQVTVPTCSKTVKNMKMRTG